jgi:uracil-DNA glycosylase
VLRLARIHGRARGTDALDPDTDPADHQLAELVDAVQRKDGDAHRMRDAGSHVEPQRIVQLEHIVEQQPALHAVEYRSAVGCDEQLGDQLPAEPERRCEPQRAPEPQGADHRNDRQCVDLLFDLVTEHEPVDEQQHSVVNGVCGSHVPRDLREDGVSDLSVTTAMPRKTSAIPARPRQLRLNAARRDADGCRRCDLWESATQTVFGTGPVDADLMLVGEQPGDQEDKAGQPFVGPAGRILDQALQAAGLGGVKRYVTNAVKHFKWEPRGKRRIHLRPNPAQMLACQYWLDQEVEFVKPKLLVALGATAVRALLGNAARVMRDRGRAFSSRYNADVLVTVHPSSILRAPDAEAREAALAAFIADLKAAAAQLRRKRPADQRT